MPSSKLQNVIIRTMRSDLEFLGSRGASAVIEKSPDQAEEILRRAQSAIRQAETERGVARSTPKQKITEGPSTPPEQDLNVLQEKVQQKTEAERKRQEEEARLEAERKRQEEEARLEAERKRQEEEARLEAERKRNDGKRFFPKLKQQLNLGISSETLKMLKKIQNY